MSKLEVVCEEVRKSCICEGEGCDTCDKKINRIHLWERIGIPAGYWIKPFKDYSGDKDYKQVIMDYISNIELKYKKGESLLLAGNLGVGKTYGMTSILKMASAKGYSARYYNMAEIMNLILSGQEKDLVSKLLELDFLGIDEFDGRWVFDSEKVQQIVGTTMEMILRGRFQNELPTILATNATESDKILTGLYGRSFSSLKSQYLKEVFIEGKDFRKK